MPRGDRTINISVLGSEELQRRLNALPAKVGKKIARKALRAGAKLVQARAKALVPVDEGDLRKSLKVRTRKRRKRQPDVFGIEVQTGTREQLGIKADAPGYYPLAVEYGYHRVDGTWIAPRSYLRAAIDATRARVIFMVKDSIRRLVESEVRLLNAGGGTK